MGKIGDRRSLLPLLDALSDSSFLVRFYAVEALGNLGDLSAVEPLIPLLKDKAWRIDESAATALGNLGDARAVGPLIETFQDRDYNNDAALESLVKLGEPALLPLFDALKDPNKNVRRNAVEALNKFGDARAIAPLTSVLYDRDPNIGYAARNAIESIRNRNLI